ncbi:hypothetical protein E4Q08_22290 [Candidatus Accumulibacter phosphatis]|jgi:hypothetical protein|uniref:TIR domain-containing protein n=1 Tax=Candidatus Accumulibacter contiguus TaxID=2954381 RepID=A0ABX1TGV5_9PROT|nr:toll/interleukin-1 receptor domain-containing protein [Candidatus Accumulibacter contiguus]NMQ07770.1 hypothetical protein [Candidatus Accumulibacter contiguus]
MVSIYVSYAWKEEEQNWLVDKLENACAARGIELLRDKTSIRYGDSIRQFMDEIGAGRHVVLVLSEATSNPTTACTSCVRSTKTRPSASGWWSRRGYETNIVYYNQYIRGYYIHLRDTTRQRVNPIVLSGTCFHKPIDRIPYIKYWEKEIADLQTAINGLGDPKYTLELRKDLDGYAECRRLIDELQSILADMNTLTEEVHVGTDFAALLDKILPQSTVAPPDPFRMQITDEIRKILACSSRLTNSLQTTMRDAGVEPSADMAASLCAVDPEQALEDLLFPATKSALAVLDPRQPEFVDTWSVAKSVLAWLSLLAVDGEWLGQASRSALSAGKLGFEIVVETPFGVELVSSRYRQIAPRLRAQKGTSEVVGDELIPQPQYETGWSDEAALDKLMLEVWARVFPEESRSTLSPKDLRTLNNELRFRDKHKTFHHYIPVPLEQASRLCRPDFYQKLLAKDRLPAITVIFFKPSGGTPALLVSDEDYFRTVIRNFLTIPEQLARKP